MSDAEFDALIRSIKYPPQPIPMHPKPKALPTPQPTSIPKIPVPQQPKIHSQQSTKNHPSTTTHRVIGTSRLQQYTHSMPKKNDIIREMQAQHITKCINHIYDTFGNKQSLDDLLKGPTMKIWDLAVTKELGRLAQGIFDVIGNDVIDFISKSEVPPNKTVTYANMVCDYRPLKNEKFRVRLTVGGDRLPYLDDATSPAASLLEAKLIINSTISQSSRNARFMTLDIKDFFLQSTMQNHEYMRIHSKYFTTELRQKYNLHEKIAKDGYVYCRIKKECTGSNKQQD